MNAHSLLRTALPLLCLLICTTGGAATVYRSVDENGVVTFSDQPPQDDTAAQRMDIDVQEGLPREEYESRLREMRETTDRMAADRREREKHRAELRTSQARAEPAPAREQPYPQTLYGDYYYPYPIYPPYYRPPHHRPGLPPGYRPKPEHPIARPPLRPPTGSSNSQLMRPIVSPRR